jgi:hypothetical protein
MTESTSWFIPFCWPSLLPPRPAIGWALLSEPPQAAARRPVVRLGLGVNACEQAGAYLRRRAMMATMSCATPTRRAARAISDGLLGPSHTHQEVEKREITGGI